MINQATKSEILLHLYSRLQQSPCTIAILQDWKRKNNYDLSNRTLYRYINELSNSIKIHGQKIEVGTGEFNKKTWKIVHTKSSKELNNSDINAHYLSKVFVPKDILKIKKSSFLKFENQFHERNSKSKLEFSVDAFSLGLDSSGFYEMQYTEHQLVIIERMIWAIQNKRKIIVEKLNPYFDSEADRIFAKDKIYPLSLLNHRGLLHMCCYNETDERIVVIGFDAFEELTPTNEIFKSKKYIELYNQFTKTHFGVTQNIVEKVYNIELEIDQVTGYYMSQFFWHYDQKFELKENKKFRMTFSCGLNGELVGWIIQWMNNLRVVKPKQLLTMVNNIHQDCIDLNNKTPSHKQRSLFWKEYVK